MKAINLCSILFVGSLALFTVSCREDNDRNNRYSTDRRDDRDARDYTADRDDNEYREVANVSVSSARQMLIGKAWKAREDLNRSGMDEGIERDGEFRFYANNTFSMMGDENEPSRTGSWSYSGSVLSLRYSGESTTHSYTVRELTEDKLKLEAADGSQLTLVEKDIR